MAYLAIHNPEKLLSKQDRARLVKTPKSYTAPSVKSDTPFGKLSTAEQESKIAEMYEKGEITL